MMCACDNLLIQGKNRVIYDVYIYDKFTVYDNLFRTWLNCMFMVKKKQTRGRACPFKDFS